MDMLFLATGTFLGYCLERSCAMAVSDPLTTLLKYAFAEQKWAADGKAFACFHFRISPPSGHVVSRLSDMFEPGLIIFRARTDLANGWDYVIMIKSGPSHVVLLNDPPWTPKSVHRMEELVTVHILQAEYSC